MSDRMKGITIYFKKPMRDDDAQAIIDACKLFPNVAKVEGSIVTSDYYFQVAQARSEIRDKILDIILETKK